MKAGAVRVNGGPCKGTDSWRGFTRERNPKALPARSPQPTLLAARRLNRAAGLLALSVLLDSALEHYRGSFKNKAMITPLLVGSLALAVSAHGTSDKRARAHRTRDATYALAALTGLVGTGFHLYNVLKRPGGLAWQNVFYGAPLGAPTAILLSGLLGVYSERVRDNGVDRSPTVLGLPAGRTLAAQSAFGLFGTSAEAGLLHLRGAYHNPFMYLPVTMPPAGAALMVETAFGPKRRNRWFTRFWMRHDRSARVCGRRISRLWHRSQHGRLAQLESEPSELAHPFPHRRALRDLRSRRLRH